VTLHVEGAPIVVDASVALPLVADADAEVVAAWVRWRSAGRLILAPPLLGIEIANALLRRRRRRAAEVSAVLRTLAATGVAFADRGSTGLLDVLPIAESNALTAYDAMYLWLAIDVDGVLATRDRQLADAARAEGVEVAEI
jgi:predicted nucleic acid-binding protein